VERKTVSVIIDDDQLNMKSFYEVEELIEYLKEMSEKVKGVGKYDNLSMRVSLSGLRATRKENDEEVKERLQHELKRADMLDKEVEQARDRLAALENMQRDIRQKEQVLKTLERFAESDSEIKEEKKEKKDA
jgi:hypothetical protein